MQSPSLTDALVQLDVVKLISAISEIIKELHVGLQKSVTLNSNFWNEKKKKEIHVSVIFCVNALLTDNGIVKLRFHWISDPSGPAYAEQQYVLLLDSL